MDRQPNKRFDDLLNLLFMIEQDKREILYRNSQTGNEVIKLGTPSRHTNSINIPDSHCERSSEN